jgi:hypothetical protein
MTNFKSILWCGIAALLLMSTPVYGLSSLSDGATVLPLPEPSEAPRLPKATEYYHYTLHGIEMTFEGHWPWPTLEVAREQAKIIAERWCSGMADAPGWPQYDRGYCVKYNTHQILVEWQNSLLDAPTP